MSEITEVPRPKITRIPTCPESHRESIDEFLIHMRNRIEKSLNDQRVAAMTTRHKSAEGTISYLRYQLSTLNWLIQINQQRRKN
jgi:hypothetical protein